MPTRKNLVKPKPRTVNRAEKDLHSKKATKTIKGPAGYVIRNAKGVKSKGK